MFKKAVNSEPKYPAHMSPECADLVSKLLVKQPAGRLGMQLGGVKEVKDHEWFHGFDWKAFQARTMPAPYVPVVRLGGGVKGRVLLCCARCCAHQLSLHAGQERGGHPQLRDAQDGGAHRRGLQVSRPFHGLLRRWLAAMLGQRCAACGLCAMR